MYENAIQARTAMMAISSRPIPPPIPWPNSRLPISPPTRRPPSIPPNPPPQPGRAGAGCWYEGEAGWLGDDGLVEGGRAGAE